MGKTINLIYLMKLQFCGRSTMNSMNWLFHLDKEFFVNKFRLEESI